jgi:NAD(P)-dependent dehydrogenase (short-subunit alcohol dehydrogenase family)
MILEEFKLEGDVAVLTGCGKSWVKDLALALAEAGASVVVTGSGKDIEIEVKEARNLQNRVIAISTDLTSTRDIQGMMRHILSQFGRIDILVNNLNLEFGKPFLKMNQRELKQVMGANLTSVFLLCKAFGKHMVDQKQGKIINIVPGAAVRGLVNGAAYCASMGGVIQLTRALALEWARENVRINAVGVGWMENAYGGIPEDAVARYIPMRRRGKPEDIASLIIFLASAASSYLSGNIYFVDGGLMARA